MSNLIAHPAAELFPLLTGDAFDEFKADIENNGLLEPIRLCDGQILDGRNRHRACAELGIEPIFKQYKGDSPVAFAWSLNGKRRHLTNSQLANIAVKMLPALEKEAKGRQGERTDLHITDTCREGSKGESTDLAAKVVGVSGRSVQRAKYVAQNDPELSTKIDSGEITVGAAYKTLKDKQRQPSRVRKINVRRVIEMTVESMSGYSVGLDLIWDQSVDITADDAREMAASMNESMRRFQRLNRMLEEIANDGGQQR